MKTYKMMVVWLATITLLITGCGGSSDSGTAEVDSVDNGEVIIGLTDAEGDFMAYAVDVVSIKLTHRNGSEVEVLPHTSRIDFAQYVDMTEFVTSAMIPNGHYEQVKLTLDYSDADIQVEVAAEPQIANVQDGDGIPVGLMEMNVKLDAQRPLVIAPGVPAHLTLDFDLEASNVVDTAASPPTVTVSPMLLADVELDDPKPHRLRGLLDEVDEAQQTIRLAVRPLHSRHGHFGHITSYVNDETHYEVDGISYAGADGLAAVAQQPEGAWVIVLGVFNSDARQFVADEVYAGSSVPGSDQDALVGVVTARDNDTLTVDARAVLVNEGGPRFNRTVQVVLDIETVVTQQLSIQDLNKDDISVGQRVKVLGDLTDSEGELSLSANHVRMMLTSVSGGVVSANDGELAVDLQHIAGRKDTMFDFSGTGQTAGQDADEAEYQIDSGVMSLAGIEINDPVRVRGFVTPFGEAPADFIARSVTDLAAVVSHMAITWESPIVAPFMSSSGSEIVIDLAGSKRHHVRRHHVQTDLTVLPQATSIVPGEGGYGVYAIQLEGSVHLYSKFAQFEVALNEALDGSVGVSRIMASGRFDNASATLNSKRVRVVLQDL